MLAPQWTYFCQQLWCRPYDNRQTDCLTEFLVGINYKGCCRSPRTTALETEASGISSSRGFFRFGTHCLLIRVRLSWTLKPNPEWLDDVSTGVIHRISLWRSAHSHQHHAA